MINAILFDMDGVLADSEDISISIGIEYFKSLGKRSTKKDFEPHLGCGEEEFFVGSARDLGLENFSYRDASAFFKREYPECIKGGIALNGGKECVERARDVGLQTALVSSAPKWKVVANIKAIGLSESSFNLIISGEDIRRNKPYPDIYQLALIKLGLDSCEAIVVEDTKGGVSAAKDAGCKTICLTTTLSFSEAEKSGADIIISDLAALNVFDSIESFNKLINEYEGLSDKAVLYGANYVAPLSRRMPFSFTLEHAIKAAWRARDNAYTPYSKYKVGAAIVSASSGRIYSGCNVENSSYGATICAERNAITSAITAEGVIGIDLLVVVSDDNPPAPPCAVCLQVIAEFAKPDTPVVLVSADGEKVEYTFKQLLPNPFIFPTMRG